MNRSLEITCKPLIWPACSLLQGKCSTPLARLVLSKLNYLSNLGFQNDHGFWNHAALHTASVRRAYRLRENLKDCYKVLNVDPENSDTSEVKEAFLKLAKEYHPDSKSTTADMRKFNQVEEAYRAICKDLAVKESDLLGEKIKRDNHLEFDIEHTAPQHRQYLEFEGIGTGTPAQRHGHYQRFRTQRAMNSVSERQMEKLVLNSETSGLVNLDKKAAKQVKTTNVIERLVEDLIKDAMNKGEFENLPYTGKPLPDKRVCPYWDISEHNMNQVLANNGYAPEWIQAEREIRSKLHDLKADLLKARLKLGPEPLNAFNQDKWKGPLRESFAGSILSLNKKVESRNLIVPLLRLQMVHFRPQREIDKVIKEYNDLEMTRSEMEESRSREIKQAENLFTTDGRFLGKIGDKIFQKLFFAKWRIEN